MMFGENKFKSDFNHHVFHMMIDEPIEVVMKGSDRYYIFSEDRVYPSVTTILDKFPNEDLKKWKESVPREKQEIIKNKATNYGTKFHDIVEKYLKNELIDVDQLLKQDFISVKPLLNRINNILAIEKVLYSNKYKIAGKVDCIAEFDGVFSIIDFKTSSRIKSDSDIQSYFEQETAYSLMFEELFGVRINQIVTIMSVHLGNPILFKKEPKDFTNSLVEKIRKFQI